MKKTALALITAVLLLGACASVPGEEAQKSGIEDVSVAEVPIPGGKTVVCVIFQGVNEGGITCDWENAK